MTEPDVTICIPAWQAESFIDRTLSCARSQTHSRLRIVVSVDQSDDATVAICRAHAGEDSRIEVFAQPERLGWSENANFLLDRVETEFYFLYFHDDIIEPTYTERLRRALMDHPEAKSAHCDLQHFGMMDHVAPGATYSGSADRRMVQFLVAPVKGAPLRSMTRTELVGRGLCFPAIGENGPWRCYPFVLQLFGEGNAVGVPEILYRRWMREGSMTKSWQPREMATLIEGQRESARLCLQILERYGDPAERELTRFCVYVFHLTPIRTRELNMPRQPPVDPAVISPAFADCADYGLPDSLVEQPPDFQEWVRAAYRELQRLERAQVAC